MNRLPEVIHWYQTLSRESLSQIEQIYHEQARFKDPFNDVVGHEPIKAIFDHMFQNTLHPAFSVTDVQQESQTAWISWRFEFGLYQRAISIDGSSRLDFCDDGRVISHIDYWDASELMEYIPVLGVVVRYLKNRLTCSAP